MILPPFDINNIEIVDQRPLHCNVCPEMHWQCEKNLDTRWELVILGSFVDAFYAELYNETHPRPPGIQDFHHRTYKNLHDYIRRKVMK